jgi:hypothetical protein
MSDIRTGWKALTHDLRSPVQGGDPLFDGRLPAVLPGVRLDTSAGECGAGWNYCAEPVTALRIAGLWPNGRPSRLFLVEASTDAIERTDKRRASSLTLVREASDAEIASAIDRFSEVFGAHARFMADEQRAWRIALGRPRRDAAAVERALKVALSTRGLAWSAKKYEAARDAWDARAAWDAWAARDAWHARDAWDAWDARAALTVAYASVSGWVKDKPEHLTAGLREAYENGLGVALPTLPNVLGWAMDEPAA